MGRALSDIVRLRSGAVAGNQLAHVGRRAVSTLGRAIKAEDGPGSWLGRSLAVAPPLWRCEVTALQSQKPVLLPAVVAACTYSSVGGRKILRRFKLMPALGFALLFPTPWPDGVLKNIRAFGGS